MKKTLLFGEPMALLLADTPGALEGVEHFTRRMSGAEVNVAIGLTRLGFPVEYLTRLGDDPFGHYIEQALKDNGIGTNLLTYDPVYRTGIQLKEYVKDGHDPAAPYYRKGSAASHLSIREIAALDLGEIGLVHVTGIPPALSKEAREATYRLMERARKAQIPVTFDPNLRPALWENDEMMRKVLMQSLGMTLMNRSLLPHGNDRVAAMGIIMKVNMIAVLILVGFAFGGQPLIGYNYGAKNRRRLKEILSFAYKFECGLGLLLTILLSLAARPMIRIFMKDNTIVSLGVPMLRMQLLGMVFVAIVLVTTCTFQSAGMARNAFLLSISRQGVIFAIVLAIASHTIGYQGILLSQAISDLLTAVLAIALYRTSVAKELHT